MITTVAFHLLELFIAMMGFPPPPSDDYETLQSGPHQIWYVGTHVPADISIKDVEQEFRDYIGHHNAYPVAFRFNVYCVSAYPCDHCGGIHLYLGLYN